MDEETKVESSLNNLLKITETVNNGWVYFRYNCCDLHQLEYPI